MIDPRTFRATMGRFATGVTVVSMRQDDIVHGITVNAFMSVSLDPPLVAVCIDKRANAHQTLLESDRYGVSVLQHDQEALSDYFAGRAVGELPDPFVELDGFPVIGGALAQMVCRIADAHEAGDHTLFIGHIESLARRRGRPLLYVGGRYAHVDELELSE